MSLFAWIEAKLAAKRERDLKREETRLLDALARVSTPNSKWAIRASKIAHVAGAASWRGALGDTEDEQWRFLWFASKHHDQSSGEWKDGVYYKRLLPPPLPKNLPNRVPRRMEDM